MIGVFLLENNLNGQSLAYIRRLAQKLLAIATRAGIVKNASVSEYPRNALVYTIRTPSPGGQLGVDALWLPAFLSGDAAFATARRPLGICAARACEAKTTYPRGFQSCSLKKLSSRLWVVPRLWLAVIRWANKRSVVQPSARAPLSSRTITSLKVPQLGQALTSFTANCTQASVTSRTLAGQSRNTRPCKPCLRGFWRWSASIYSYSTCQRKTSHV